MTVMALVLISSVSEGSLLKGLFSGLVGALVAMPGLDESSGQMRLTFGFVHLTAGFAILPVLVGLFAFSQILKDVLEIDREPERAGLDLQGLFPSLREWLDQGWNLMRSCLIGIWIGILPGIGPNIASVVAYTTAKNFSKTPERFGTGAEEGIVAAESSNNAAVGGSLIPLITLGIPGSVIDALLIGALIIHNIQPGPMLFRNNPEMIYAMIGTCLLSTFAMFAMMILAVRPLASLMYVPKSLIVPAILVSCVTGVFAYDNSIFDVWVMIAFGVVGFVMERARIPLGPFVIGLILAPIAESALRSGLMLTAGSYWPLLTRPMSALFLAVALVFAIWPVWRERRARRAVATGA
jgi:putative tricarboxylic transport membrane protein